MKRTTDILILTAVLILTGCKGVSSLEPETGTSAPRPIEFGISSDFSVESKALISNANVKEYTFTAYGNLTVDGTQQTGLFGNNGTVVQWDATANSNAGAWSYSPARYWQPGSYVFAGVMPSIDGMTASLSATNALTLNFGTEGYNLAIGQHDLMVDFQNATVQSPSSAEAVTFAFKHQLALVDFHIQLTNDEHMDVFVNSIKVHGICKSATRAIFTRGNSDDVITATWNLGDKSSSTDSYVSVTPGTDPSIRDLLVFPVSDTNGFTIEVKYTENYGTSSYIKDKSATIAYNWESGKKYVYRFTLSSDSIVFDDVTITDWTDGGAADTIPEM